MNAFNKLRVIFMGTPEFAAFILNDLINQGVQIIGVVTAPDRPAGRGQQNKSSEVKQVAQRENIPIMQPIDLKEEEFIRILKAWNADVFVVVAFRMLPKVVWSIPPKGTFNLHASLLPDFRGAAPIHRAIMAGCSETGLTTFFIDEQIDTGAIIEQVRMEIGEDENVGHLHDRMKIRGAELVASTLEALAKGEVTTVSQNHLLKGEERNAPKLYKEDCRIQWSEPVNAVHNFIRGLSPFPTAWTRFQWSDRNAPVSFKIFSGKKTQLPVEDKRKIKQLGHSLYVPCEDYYYEVLELQPEGKRRMHTKEFLAGNTLNACFLTNEKA